MATRQYIGARYVPKFYDFNGSPEWRSGVAYESLTVVTRNGNSYTSKVPVPSNIGAPENNPQYWVSTGLYNQQVEEYRQLTLSLSDRVDDLEAEGAIGTDNLANGAVTTAKIADTNVTTAKIADNAVTGSKIADNAITASKIADNAITTDKIADESITKDKIAGRKFIFIGDSYTTSGYGNIFGVLPGMLGLSQGDYWNGGIDGGSFYQGTFLSSLTSIVSTLSDAQKNSITDIVVMGGLNDSKTTVTYAEIRTAITAFSNYAATNLPNAIITLCYLGNNKQGVDGQGNVRTSNARIQAFGAYSECGANPNMRFVNNLQYILHNYNLMRADGIHPTESGGSVMAAAMKTALLDGSYGFIHTTASIPQATDNIGTVAEGSPANYDVTDFVSRIENGIIVCTCERISGGLNSVATVGGNLPYTMPIATVANVYANQTLYGTGEFRIIDRTTQNVWKEQMATIFVFRDTVYARFKNPDLVNNMTFNQFEANYIHLTGDTFVS